MRLASEKSPRLHLFLTCWVDNLDGTKMKHTTPFTAVWSRDQAQVRDRATAAGTRVLRL